MRVKVLTEITQRNLSIYPLVAHSSSSITRHTLLDPKYHEYNDSYKHCQKDPNSPSFETTWIKSHESSNNVLDQLLRLRVIGKQPFSYKSFPDWTLWT